MWPLRAEVGTSVFCSDAEMLRGRQPYLCTCGCPHGRQALQQIFKWAMTPTLHTHTCSLRPMQPPLLWVSLQDTHLLYVLAAANLYAQMHGLPGSQDQTALRGLLNWLPLPDPQNLDRIFASELELDSPSGEFGEVPSPDPSMLPPKGLSFLGLCCRKKMGLGALKPSHNLSGPLTLLFSSLGFIPWSQSRFCPSYLPSSPPHSLGQLSAKEKTPQTTGPWGAMRCGTPDEDRVTQVCMCVYRHTYVRAGAAREEITPSIKGSP